MVQFAYAVARCTGADPAAFGRPSRRAPAMAGLCFDLVRRVVTGLLLIAVDADALGAALRWERSRNDELFPHLYGELDLGAVTGIYDMPARSDGTHVVPELAP